MFRLINDYNNPTIKANTPTADPAIKTNLEFPLITSKN